MFRLKNSPVHLELNFSCAIVIEKFLRGRKYV